ncbi:MAG: TetR family transcriptional regulator [Microthrixaceae bacterium]|nr:TetR family transcriptional regulator [Microthrixaceae bacterium]
MAEAGTARERGKADRTAALLAAATTLFAERGFAGVSMEQLGAAVGISGPAVYRHFANKQAVLAAVLRQVSTMLLDGGQRVRSSTEAVDEQLRLLVAFHVDFALDSTDVIRVQDRDLASLGAEARHEVRRIQREYVELWVGVLRGLHPDESAERLRIRAHAGFGLMNSTPHSARGAGVAPATAQVRSVLQSLALAALRDR